MMLLVVVMLRLLADPKRTHDVVCCRHVRVHERALHTDSDVLDECTQGAIHNEPIFTKACERSLNNYQLKRVF